MQARSAYNQSMNNLLWLAPVSTLYSFLHPLVHLFIRTTRTFTDTTITLVALTRRGPDTLAELRAVTFSFGTGPHTHTWVCDEFVRNVWPRLMGWKGFVEFLGDFSELG